MAKLHEVHQSRQRIHVMEKMNGCAIYGADLHLPHMLYAKGVVTGCPYGEIRAIHTEEALNIPGVRGVYTAEDIPGHNGFGAFCKDEPILAERYVKFAGDVVAVVVADSPVLAEQGAKAVRVELTPLKPVLTVEEALSGEIVINPAYPDNLCASQHLIKGDAAAALAQAEVVVEETYETAWVEHAYLEPEAVVVLPLEGGGLEMRGSTQNPFFNRNVICEALCLTEKQVVIHPDTLGGSFGGKCEQISAMAVRAGIAALRLNRPVSYVFTREESILQSLMRHGIRTHIRLGADHTGILTALEARAVMDGGAYVNESPIVTWKSTNCGAGPYRFPAVYYENKAVMTNNMVCGAMRGFGTPQAIFALESAMNELAQRLHMNPLELRRKNFLRRGDTTASGQLLQGHVVSINTVAQRVAQTIRFDEKFETYSHQTGSIRRGVGIACSIRGVSFGADSEDVGRARLTVLPDGRVEVRCPMMEMGQGAETVLTQICADGLQIPLEQVNWCQPETAHSPDTGPAGASRGTFIGGNSILMAIAALKGQIAACLCVNSDTVSFSHGRVFVEEHPYSWAKIARLLSAHGCQDAAAMYKVPDAKWDNNRCQGDAFISYVYSCHAAEVEVDTDTGQVKVLQMVGCHDAGRIINPQMAAGQVTGGMVMGIGMALTEAVETDPKNGIIRSDNFDSYILPTARDACRMTVFFEENPDNCGPFGGKSLGEPAMEPAPAAVSGAVNMALGSAGALRRIPTTLEDVFFAAHPEYKGDA